MRRAGIALVVVLMSAPAAWAGGLQNQPELVLDIEEGSFRLFMGWKVPTLATDQGETRPLLRPKTVGAEDAERDPVPVARSWYPPADWAQVDFDDTYWPRTRGPVMIQQPARFGDIWSPGHAAEWNLILLRGRFRVTDPAKVVMLRLDLQYHGGAVVYVNGREVQRGHLPAGPLTFETPADPFPIEAYVRPDGALYGFADNTNRDYFERFAKRVRRIPPKDWTTSVGIPKDLLRKGVNVIAIEVHAAPVNEVAAEGTAKAGSWQERPCTWPHVAVIEAKVLCGAPNGLEQNVAPSEGVHVSTVHPWETLRAHDYAHPQDEPLPIKLVGARNGAFSGRVVVSSRDTIWGLKGTASALKRVGGDQTIPASAIQVRYAEPSRPQVSWRRWPLFDRLLEAPPDEIPAVPIKIRGRTLQPVPTALVPVWITVHVAPDAAPGDYEGHLTITTDDSDPVSVPVRLTVHDYRLPDPADYLLTQGIYQSEDSVSLYYNVPRWSDRHFELMGKSFEILREMGARVLCLNLCELAPNINNVESIVRWVKHDDGTYTYDFSHAERYMDLFEKVVGKPRVLAIYTQQFEGRENEAEPRSVTVFDPKTGKTESLKQPPYGTQANKDFWTPLFKELKERLLKRGWYDVAAIGHVSYCWSPTKETAANFKEIWPDGKWISSCHGYRSDFGGLPVIWNEWVWASGNRYNPDAGGKPTYPQPWVRRRKGFPIYDLKIARGAFRDNHPVPAYRTWPEAMMQLDLHGPGRLGGDFWPVSVTQDGRLTHLCDTAYALGHAINVIAMISPGPNGAIWNERAEAYRQGVQVAETIAFIRKALADNKLDEKLAARVEAHLTDRARHYCRTGWGTDDHWRAFAASGVHVRDHQLFTLAAEVEKHIAKGT